MSRSERVAYDVSVRFEAATLLRILHHRQPDPVLDTLQRIEKLTLRKNRRGVRRQESIDTDHRGVAYTLNNVIKGFSYWHGGYGSLISNEVESDERSFGGPSHRSRSSHLLL